jgi:addiction module RelE/StbE family toxin
MIFHKILYDKEFKKEFVKLPREIQKKAVKAESLFLKDVFHPSLRLHKLKGSFKDIWSISVDRKYRVIFKPLGDGTAFFISIGMHAIYDV